jgi:hypothetical protein
VNRLTRILPVAAVLLGTTLIFGCASELTAPDSPGDLAFAEVRTDPPTLTPCRPQPYAATAGWIGPRGGILKAGKHTLRVPPSALATTTWITMEVPSSSINRVVFGPEGLTFKNAALLTMSYSNCSVTPGAQQYIVYINDQNRIIETTQSVSDPLTQTVTGTVTHFSDYALSTYAVVY